MASFNRVILVGNLTRDVEMKYTAKGSAIANVSIAVNRKWKSESGEQKEEVCFVECVAFGNSAETMAKYLSKGKPVLIDGRLKLDSWEDKATGQKRSKLGVVIENFQFLGSGEKPKQSEAPKAETAPDDDGQSVPF